MAVLAGCGHLDSEPGITPCYAAEAKGWVELQPGEFPDLLREQIQEDGFLEGRYTYHRNDTGSYFVCFQDPYCSSEVWTYRLFGTRWLRIEPDLLMCE